MTSHPVRSRTNRQFAIGTRVEGGAGDDHDIGVVGAPTAFERSLPGHRDIPNSVWVRWESGVSCWTPVHLIHRA
jgi:hypothetical protein